MKEKILAIFDKIDIRYLLCLVFIANLVDAYLTLTWVELGVATEANPIMAFLLDLGQEWFLIGKIVSISAACLILYHLRELRASKVVAILSCVLYLGIIVIHILGSRDVGMPLF